jgi:DNA invertase Pin-like site-specific DNA recombinase
MASVPRFVAYYRVSTARQGKSGLGLEAQRRAVAAMIGGAPDHEFTEVESGKRSSRPELTKALDLAELIGATLVVAKLDRLSRDAEFLHKLLKHPATPKFADMPFAGKMEIGVMAVLAEWEREQISRRTKEALAVAKARGKRLGGDRGNLARVGARGRTVSARQRRDTAARRCRMVLPHVEEAKAAGSTTTRSIAAWLNAKGIETARGNGWTSSAVSRLLARSG